MKTKEEIQQRIDDLEELAEIQKLHTEEGMRSFNKCQFEIAVLNWVLGNSPRWDTEEVH